MNRKREGKPSEVEQQIKKGEQALELTKETVVIDNKGADFVSGYTENRDLVNQVMGRNQILNAISKAVDVTMIMDWKRMKDSKAYQSLSSHPGNFSKTRGKSSPLGDDIG